MVRAAFQAVLVQGSVSQAAKWLNDTGYVLLGPLRGGGFRPRRKHFTFDSLYRLVANPAYAGRRVIRKKGGKVEIVQAVWPALIDPALFDRAQKVLAEGKMQKTGRESRYPYLLSTRIFCGECQAPLIGNSAHGRAGKLPYYGHGSQIRREHALKVKGHRCDPFRVPGRKLEERVWKEVVSLIEKPAHRAPLFEAIRKLSESRSEEQETERREAELVMTEGKLANLAKRIADLPTGIPANALYDEMKRLAENQTRLKAEVQESRRRGDERRLVSAVEYDRLLGKLRDQLTDLSPETKRRIVQALVQKVVVTKDGFELHFYVGMDQIKTGEALAFPAVFKSKNPGQKKFGPGSIKLLNGWSDWG